MNETTWTLAGILTGWLLCLISLWIGICIGVHWKVKENMKILRPWKKKERRFPPIAEQTGASLLE